LSLALTAAPAAASSSPDTGGATPFWPQGHHRYPGDSRHLGDRILRFGMHGHDVRVLQDFLSRAGFATPIVGAFGPLTKHNVVAFELSRGLRPNGVVTWGVSQALRGAVAARAAREVRGARARLVGGLALAPASAPAPVKAVIAAGNQIAFRPYLYGGGHGSWLSSGYDCSGSVSFALHGGGLLTSPEDSTTLESYGSAGPGSWITIFANAGHAYMIVAGLRFDTSAQSSTGGSRWTSAQRSSAGYVVRHPTGF
jgi:peptidoglycan hydrolase-like protein with peptidoglycan-binding domain